MNKELKALLAQCKHALSKAIYQEKEDYGEDAKLGYAEVFCNDGYIELYATSVASYATVIHNDNDNISLNVENLISNSLPQWDDIEVPEDEPHEFMVDPGFANYQDYLNWKYN